MSRDLQRLVKEAALTAQRRAAAVSRWSRIERDEMEDEDLTGLEHLRDDAIRHQQQAARYHVVSVELRNLMEQVK